MMVILTSGLRLSLAWIWVLAVFIEMEIFIHEFFKRPVGLDGAVVHCDAFKIGLNFVCFECLTFINK